MAAWKEERARLEAADLEERRENYGCGEDFTPLADVPAWADDAQSVMGKLSDKERKKIQKELLQEPEDSDTSADDQVTDLARKVSVFVGDITKLEIDAIVNAANNSLLGGGGVDGAIHRAAGPLLLAENRTLGGCGDGEAVLSGGYRLPARYVISTVGPQGEKPEVLAAAYSSCLQLMLDTGLRSIAFPCISTGVYGYPGDAACGVALRTVRSFLQQHGHQVDRVVFCLFLPADVRRYRDRLPVAFPARAGEEEEAGEEQVTGEKEAGEAVEVAATGVEKERMKEEGTEEVVKKDGGEEAVKQGPKL